MDEQLALELREPTCVIVKKVKKVLHLVFVSYIWLSIPEPA